LFGNYVSLGAEYERSTTGGGDMLGEKFVFPWKFSVAGFELSLKEQIELKSQVAGAKAEHSKVFEDASLKIALPFADFPYVIATYNREAIAGMYTGAEKYEDWTKQKFSLTGQLPGLSGSTFMGGLQLDNKGRGSNGNFLIAPAVIGQIVVPVGVPKPHVVRAEERTAASHVSEPVVRKDSVVTPVAVPVVVKKDSVVTPVIAPVVVKKDSTAAPAAVVRKDSAQYFVERGGILVPMTREDQAKIDSLVEKGRHAVIPFSSDSLPGLQNHLVISVIDLAKDFQKYAKLYHLAFAYHDGLYALSVPAAAGMPNSFLDPLSGETRTAVRFPHWVYVEQKAAFDGTLPLPWAGNAPTVAVRMAFDQKNYTLMTYYCAKDLAALVKAGYRFSPTLRDNEYLLLAPDGTRSVIRISPEAAKSIVSSSGTERDLGGIDMNLSGVLSSSTVSAPSAGLWGSAIRGLSVKSVRLYAVSSLDRFFV